MTTEPGCPFVLATLPSVWFHRAMQRGTAALIGSIILSVSACSNPGPVSSPQPSSPSASAPEEPVAACAGRLVTIDGPELVCWDTGGGTTLEVRISEEGLDEFVLSPTGALAAIRGGPFEDGGASGDVWTSTPDAPHRFTRVARLSEPDEYPMSLAWSDDGETLYVATSTYDGEQAKAHTIYVLGTDGNLDQLARFDGACCYEYPAFGSSTASLVHTFIGIADGLGHYHSLRQIDLGSGAVRDLAIDIAQNPDGTDEGPPGPLFTTDGSSFAVLTDAGRGVERVDLPDLTRTELHTVSQDHRIVRPSPSPDGRMMLVQVLAVTEPFSEDQPPPRVMLLDTRTGEAVRVRELDRGWWWFTWSPDGTLAYARRSDRTAGGIWDRTRAVFDPWEDPPEDVLGWVRA